MLNPLKDRLISSRQLSTFEAVRDSNIVVVVVEVAVVVVEVVVVVELVEVVSVVVS